METIRITKKEDVQSWRVARDLFTRHHEDPTLQADVTEDGRLIRDIVPVEGTDETQFDVMVLEGYRGIVVAALGKMSNILTINA